MPQNTWSLDGHLTTLYDEGITIHVLLLARISTTGSPHQFHSSPIATNEIPFTLHLRPLQFCLESHDISEPPLQQAEAANSKRLILFMFHQFVSTVITVVKEIPRISVAQAERLALLPGLGLGVRG